LAEKFWGNYTCCQPRSIPKTDLLISKQDFLHLKLGRFISKENFKFSKENFYAFSKMAIAVFSGIQ